MTGAKFNTRTARSGLGPRRTRPGRARPRSRLGPASFPAPTLGVLLVVWAALSIGCGNRSHSEKKDAADLRSLKTFSRWNWMSHLDDRTLLRQMSIPGTHASTSYVLTEPDVVYLRNQRHDIRDQLQHGVRFLDVRFGCAGPSGVKIVRDESYSDVDPGDAFFSVAGDFLVRHPTEFVVARVMPQGIPSDCGREMPMRVRYEALVRRFREQYPRTLASGGKWRDDTGLSHELTLGALRGKLVLLPQYLGVVDENAHTAHWADTEMSVQDRYEPSSVAQKRHYIREHFRALSTTGNDHIWINFLSAETEVCDAVCYSRGINDWARDEVLERREGRTGVVLLDFAVDNLELVDLIISKNTLGVSSDR